MAACWEGAEVRKEYSEDDLKAVWRELVRVFGEQGAGCAAREVAAATGLSEEAATEYLEYLRIDGKVVREGNVYAPNPRYAPGKDVVRKTIGYWNTPEAAPGHEAEVTFGQQKAGGRSLPYKEVLAYLRRRPYPYPSTAEIAVALSLYVGDVREALEILRGHGTVERFRNRKGYYTWRATEI